MSDQWYFDELQREMYDAVRADALGLDDEDVCLTCQRISVPAEGCVACGDPEGLDGAPGAALGSANTGGRKAERGFQQ